MVQLDKNNLEWFARAEGEELMGQEENLWWEQGASIKYSEIDFLEPNCDGPNCVHQISHVETLIPNVPIFRNRAFKRGH